MIFDMDGVITDSEPIHDEALASVLGASGISLTREVKSSILGTTVDETWQRLQDQFQLAGPLEGWKQRYIDLVCRLLSEKAEPAAGLYDVLSWLEQRGLKAALASSSPRVWVDIVLRKLDVSHRFQAVVAGDEVVKGKPDPEIFIKTAHSLELPPHQCLVIEDSPAGLTAANSAGMRSVGVLTPYTTVSNLSHADHVISSLQSFDPSFLH